MRLLLTGGVLGLGAGAGWPSVQAAGPGPQANETPQAAPAGGGAIPYTDVNHYGANIFLHKEVEQVKIERTLQMAKDGGLTMLKQQFPWDEIEFKKGYFHDDKWDKDAWAKFDNIVAAAEKVGVTLVARIDHAPIWARLEGSGSGDAPKDANDLADFVAAFLQHYQGRIKYLQIWNEPNLHYEWADNGKVDPAAYTALLKTVYTRAKATDPTVAILSAPMAITLEDWPKDDPQYRRNLSELVYWDEMYAAGAKDYFDLMSANAYGLDQPPEAAPAPTVLNFRRVELLHDVMVRHGDANKAVWFNEYGWNASPTTLSQEQQLRWRRVDTATQAGWTVDGIAYANTHWPWAGVFFIWYLRQVGDIPPDNAEYYFQMVDPDFNPQPIYTTVQQRALSAPPAQASATPLAVATAPVAPATAVPPTAVPVATEAAPPAAATATAPPEVITLTPVDQPTPGPGAAGSESSPLVPALLFGGLALAALAAGAFMFMRNRR